MVLAAPERALTIFLSLLVPLSLTCMWICGAMKPSEAQASGCVRSEPCLQHVSGCTRLLTVSNLIENIAIYFGSVIFKTIHSFNDLGRSTFDYRLKTENAPTRRPPRILDNVALWAMDCCSKPPTLTHCSPDVRNDSKLTYSFCGYVCRELPILPRCRCGTM